MSEYRVNALTKISAIFMLVFFIAVTSFIIFIDGELSTINGTILIVSIAIIILGIYAFYKTKIIIDDNMIQFKGCRREGRSLLWEEIDEVDSGYFLFPESGWVTLIPKNNLTKKEMQIMFGTISLDIVKDIISHLKPDTKMYFYPYLERKLRNKQTWFYKY